MINAALELPFPVADADDFEVEITIRSWKHDCHTAYRLNKMEIEQDRLAEIIRGMSYRLQDFIKEKENGETHRC